MVRAVVFIFISILSVTAMLLLWSYGESRKVEEIPGSLPSTEKNEKSISIPDELTACDREALAAAMADYVMLRDFLTPWEHLEATLSTSSELLAWDEETAYSPCLYQVSYQNLVDSDQLTLLNPFKAISRRLEADGWSRKPNVKLPGDMGTIALGHARGPLGDSEVWVKFYPEQNSVQFMSLEKQLRPENWAAYREGESDSMCPCEVVVQIGISAQVPIN